ncbi:hypothetical protein GGF43_005044, partial [Coemansia sp. RSA 2618]
MRKLRSPPFRAGHVRTDSSSSASRQSPSASASSLERVQPNAVGTKLAMLKTSIGSFLARPLSPRVNATQQQQQQHLGAMMMDEARVQPSPLSEVTSRAAPLSFGSSSSCSLSAQAVARNRSVENVPAGALRPGTAVPQTHRQLQVQQLQQQTVYARMPLSAVGGSFASSVANTPAQSSSSSLLSLPASQPQTEPKAKTATVPQRLPARPASASTDEDVGIAASVSRIAPKFSVESMAEEDVRVEEDLASLTSISSLSVSTLPSEGSLSDISMASAANTNYHNHNHSNGGGGGVSADASPLDACFAIGEAMRGPASPLGAASAGYNSSDHSSTASGAVEPLPGSASAGYNAMEVSPPGPINIDNISNNDDDDDDDDMADASPFLFRDTAAAMMSPRLSLRLSGDASTFGMGLSVFASLMDAVEKDALSSSSLNMMSDSVVVEGGDPVIGDDPVIAGKELSSIGACVQAEVVEPAQTELIESVAQPEVVEPVQTESVQMEVVEPVQNESVQVGAAEPVQAETVQAEPVQTETVQGEPIQTEAAEPVQAEAAQAEPAAQEPAAPVEENPAVERLRSLRSRRLREKEAALSKRPAAMSLPSKAPAEEDSLGAPGRRFRATQTAARRPNTGALAAMGSLQLDRLTKLNTRRNATYMTCEIERVVVVRHGDRPPSPSLLMQERVQERRIVAELDGEPYHSIYSSEESGCESSSSSDDDDGGGVIGADSAVTVDTRPLSPEPDAAVGALGPDAADLPALVASASTSSCDVKRKSFELASSTTTTETKPADSSLASSSSSLLASPASGPSKKQCLWPRRVHWGTRSVLQATWLLGRSPPPMRAEGASKPILTRRLDASDEPVGPSSATSTAGAKGSGKGRRQSRSLSVVKVSCFEYPDHMVDENYDEEYEDEDDG